MLRSCVRSTKISLLDEFILTNVFNLCACVYTYKKPTNIKHMKSRTHPQDYSMLHVILMQVVFIDKLQERVGLAKLGDEGVQV